MFGVGLASEGSDRVAPYSALSARFVFSRVIPMMTRILHVILGKGRDPVCRSMSDASLILLFTMCAAVEESQFFRIRPAQTSLHFQ